MAVSVTVFVPTFEQSKDVLSKAKPDKPTTELDPLSTCCGVMVAFPTESKDTTMFFVITVGTGSMTVTGTETVVAFPLASVPVNCTVTGLLVASLAPKLLLFKV